MRWIPPLPLDALLLRGAEVYAPECLGVCDVLSVGGRIAAVEPDITAPPISGLREIDVHGHVVTPAFVDQHCHLIGGGGWGGSATRNPPIRVSEILSAGVGTVVGCLGHDTTVRRPEALLDRARYLAVHGITSYMFTGEIGHPPVTLTGSVRKDLALINEVIGVKAAVAEHGVGLETASELGAMYGEAYRGSRAGNKTTVLHVHLGLGSQQLSAVVEAVERGVLEPTALTVTHVNWNAELLAAAASLAKAGVNLDLTACIRSGYFLSAIEPSDAIVMLRAAGVEASQLTVSSDAGGCHASDDGSLVVHQPSLLGDVLRGAVLQNDVPLGNALAMLTRSPADRLGLITKGRLEPGAAADLLVLTPELRERHLFLRGREVLRDGFPTVFDVFEGA